MSLAVVVSEVWVSLVLSPMIKSQIEPVRLLNTHGMPEYVPVVADKLLALMPLKTLL